MASRKRNINKRLFLTFVGAIIISFTIGGYFISYLYTQTLLLPINYSEKYKQIYRQRRTTESFIETYINLVDGVTYNYNSRISEKSDTGLQIGSATVQLLITEDKEKDLITSAKKYNLIEWQELVEIGYQPTIINNHESILATVNISEDKRKIEAPYKGGVINPFEKLIGKKIKAYFFKRNNKLYVWKAIGNQIPKEFDSIVETFDFIY